MSLKVSGFSSAALQYKIVFFNNASNTPTSAINENVTGTSGRWYSVDATNASGSAVYVRLSDGSAPTLGTTAADWQFHIPANSSKRIEIPTGAPFTTGLNLWTGGNSDPKSSNAPAAGGVTVTVVCS